MPSIIDQLRAFLEGPIDFEGQRKADRYTQYILISSAVLGFLLGFVMQDLRVTFGVFGTGFLGALLMVVPPWQMYNQNPISWLPATKKDDTSAVVASDTRKTQ